MTVRVRRVYDDPAPDDGFRVLVDRLWPRGISKDRAALGLWCKGVAPSTALRQWFHAAERDFGEFAGRYTAELADNPAVAELRDIVAREAVVTLVYGAKAPSDRNHATVLARYLDQT